MNKIAKKENRSSASMTTKKKQILEEWVKRNKDPKDLEEMDDFIKKNCPEWYNDLKRSEQYLLR
ncbi:MAG TPA: hypothetical protein VN316_01935 [candidate division Zixibacteria bacterium]|nr:hypothetical protein [candidate division Zixibacteria bacterium]